MLMLDFHVVDAETFGHRVWKIHEVKRPFRIIGMRGVLEDRRLETEAHDPDAAQLGRIRALPPHTAGGGNRGRTHKKLSSLQHYAPPITVKIKYIVQRLIVAD
jgi:hypothetical protein